MTGALPSRSPPWTVAAQSATRRWLWDCYLWPDGHAPLHLRLHVHPFGRGREENRPVRSR